MSTPQPDHDASVAFLKEIHPTGPWALTAIDLHDRKTHTNTFFIADEPQMRKWLTAHGKRNIYYHLAEVARPVTCKAERKDLARVWWFHVDLDPRAGEDLASERERIQKLLHNLPAGIPGPPTKIVFSGGGYQPLWKLREPIEVDENEKLADAAGRYNLQLEILLGGDACHDVSRILRLPGTVNWPDERKIAKGRQPTLAEVVYSSDAVYDVSQFVAAPELQTPMGKGLPGFASVPRMVHISGNVARLTSVQELGEKVSDRCKMVIVRGHDPDEPNKWPSRSECLFWVLCELVRADISDDVIYSVITDPDFLISASVLDKGSRSDRYAKRQIQRARENAVDPWLEKMNERHAVIGNYGGKCVVIEEVMDHALRRPRLTKQSFTDVRNRYLHIKVDTGLKDKHGNPILKSLGNWWLEQENRQQFTSIVFNPGQEEIEDAYNLWQGFACKAVPGDCSIYLDHVKRNICNNNDEVYQFLIRWLARVVQHPDTAGEVAVVLRGRRGTGKSVFIKEFGMLFGRHFLPVSDSKHLVGSFNAHLRDCVVLFGDEAFYAGDKRHESVLKTLITEEYLAVEAKGVDVELARNFVHLLLASNADWVVPAGVDERRFLVIDVGRGNQQDPKYFAELRQQMNNGGREALLHYLLTMDLNGWEVRTAPKTDALREQQLLSMLSEEEWWYRKLHEGIVLSNHLGWGAPILKDRLLDDYLTYAQRVGGPRRANATSLGKFLSKMVPDLRAFQGMAHRVDEAGHTRKERAYFYQLPPLVDCRKAWDERFGNMEPWPVVDDKPHEVTDQPF